MTIPTPAPFDLDTATRTITEAVIGLVTITFRDRNEPLDPEQGTAFFKQIQEALLAGSSACAEIKTMRDGITGLRDAHRPRPSADPERPAPLCAACSMHGAIVSWPCEAWTAADRILTQGQP